MAGRHRFVAPGAARREPVEVEVVRDAAGDRCVDGWREGATEPAAL